MSLNIMMPSMSCGVEKSRDCILEPIFNKEVIDGFDVVWEVLGNSGCVFYDYGISKSQR